MNLEHGNYTENTSIIDLLLTVKSNIFKTMHTSSVCIVKEAFDDGSFRCSFIDESNIYVDAICMMGVEAKVDDAVLVIFTDRDYRASLNAYKNNQQNTNSTTKSYHDLLFGIVVGIVARRQNSQ